MKEKNTCLPQEDLITIDSTTMQTDTICKKICIKITSMRKDKEINLQSLSEATRIPLSVLHNIEQNIIGDFDIEQLYAICSFLNVSIRDFFHELDT